MKILRSKKGISPILATLLLIVIAVAAVIVTYAWVMTFTISTTSTTTVLSWENVRYHRTDGNFTEIVIRNTGTADAKIASVYWSKTGSNDLALVGSGEYTVSPYSKVVAAGNYATITVTWGGTVVNDTPGGGWQSGVTYYWKIVTEAGQSLPFAAKAP